MNTLDTLKLAFDFVERTATYLPHLYDEEGLKVHSALDQAIKQAEQAQPVARVVNKSVVFRPCDLAGLPLNAPLYTAPPHRQPMTDEQIMSIAPVKMTQSMRALVRAIEKAHGIEPELPF